MIPKKNLRGRSLGLMTHIIVGYPSLGDNWVLLELMEEAGVAVVEIQFPFSEPVADGPLFAKANQLSIERGTTTNDALDLLRRAREAFSFPILMMGYYNTVFRRGEAHFVKELESAGAAGMILPDLPLEEARPIRKLATDSGLGLVQLAAPNSPAERLTRMVEIANEDSSMIYAVARKGVTGKKTSFDPAILDYLDSLKNELEVPLAVGFGLSSSEDLDLLEGHADLGVIGTAVLRHWESGGISAVRKFFRGLA